MINPNSIYRKTDAGVAEIQSRALGLRTELRRVLILTDGTTTVAKLAAFVRAAEIEMLVTELEQRGLVVSGSNAGAIGFGPLPVAELPPLTDITVTPSINVSARADNLLEPSAAQMLAVRRTAVNTSATGSGPWVATWCASDPPEQYSMANHGRWPRVVPAS